LSLAAGAPAARCACARGVAAQTRRATCYRRAQIHRERATSGAYTHACAGASAALAPASSNQGAHAVCTLETGCGRVWALQAGVKLRVPRAVGAAFGARNPKALPQIVHTLKPTPWPSFTTAT
jgi:hypothetical protein